MQENQLDPLFYRNKGWEFIERGQELFISPQQINDRKKGYLIFKKGLEFMIKYAKMEPNRTIVDKVKEKLEHWLEQARKMEAVIYNDDQEEGRKPLAMSHEKHPPVSPRVSGDNSVSPKPSPRRDTTKDGSVSPRNQKVKIKEGDADRTKLQTNLESAIVTEKPNVKWEDIAGLENAKKALQEAVIFPIKYPQLFEGMRTPWKGILLYGPPGTGKTFLAKACASEADSTFFSVSAADLMSKYVGESEKLIKTMFKMARERRPAIIFIDEIDSLLAARNDDENEASKRVKTQFLVEMQGVSNDDDKGILVLGATNIPWVLDPAVRRRFEKRIYIPLPDLPARRALLEKQLHKTPNSLQPGDVDYLVDRTEGYSGADLVILIRDACFEPIRNAQKATHFKVIDNLPGGKPIYQPCQPNDLGALPMTMYDIDGPQLRLKTPSLQDFEVALQKTKPTVGLKDLKKQEEFTELYGIEG